MEKSEVKLPKRRKASNSSQKSEKSDHGETVSVRQKEYKNLLRLESLNPSGQGSISPINQIVNLQDSELKEITAFIGYSIILVSRKFNNLMHIYKHLKMNICAHF